MFFFHRFLAAVLLISLLLLGFKGLYRSSESPTRGSTKLLEVPTFHLDRAAIEHFGEGPLGSKYQRYRRLFEKSFVYLGANTRPDQAHILHFFQWDSLNFALHNQEPLSFKELGVEDVGSEDLFFKIMIQGNDTVHVLVFTKDMSVFEHKISYKASPSAELLGDHKLDRNLLVRQKLSWNGQDLFLSDQGAEEFPEALERERLDFYEHQDPYFCFAKEGDLFIFKEGVWQKAVGKTQSYPLMHVQNVKERSLEIVVWDVSGRGCEKYTITKSNGRPIPKSLGPLKFVGAKSKERWLVETPLERFSVTVGDWLIHQNNAWKKIETIEALEQYIEQINQGELFIIQRFKIHEGLRVLEGELYNTTRTEKMFLELPIEDTTRAKES